jgi:hypothetical protein
MTVQSALWNLIKVEIDVVAWKASRASRAAMAMDGKLFGHFDELPRVNVDRDFPNPNGLAVSSRRTRPQPRWG